MLDDEVGDSGRCWKTGKVKLFTRRHAKLLRRQRPYLRGKSIYRCEFCHLFHLGSLPPPVKKGTLGRHEMRAHWRDEWD